LVLKFFNIKIPKDQIFQRKKNTPIRPASLDDLTATKEVFLQISELLSHHGALDFYGAGGSKEGRKG
jgi:hypothetical protein